MNLRNYLDTTSDVLRSEQTLAQKQIDVLKIKCRDSKQRLTELSGGNKQKVVFSKWLGCESDILILDCATRGIDVGVKAAIYQLLEKMKAEGKSIVLISEELPEMIGMCDRMLVMKDGEITAEFRRSAELTEADNVHADGSCVRAARARYACHYKQRHPGECEGPSGYGIKTLDGLVDRVVKSQLQRIKDQPTEELLSSQQQEMINLMSARCKILSLQVCDKQQEIADYESETIKVIRGQSKFSAELLTSLSAKEKEEQDELKEALEEAQAELDRLQSEDASDCEEYDRLIGWADIYDRCSFETKKMFVSKFIKSVRVFRDYRLEIDFNVSYEEFQNLTVQTAV